MPVLSTASVWRDSARCSTLGQQPARNVPFVAQEAFASQGCGCARSAFLRRHVARRPRTRGGRRSPATHPGLPGLRPAVWLAALKCEDLASNQAYSHASSCFLTEPVTFSQADIFPHVLPGQQGGGRGDGCGGPQPGWLSACPLAGP